MDSNTWINTKLHKNIISLLFHKVCEAILAKMLDSFSPDDIFRKIGVYHKHGLCFNGNTLIFGEFTKSGIQMLFNLLHFRGFYVI